jgi:transcription termination/antitermination protein NusG
MQAASAWFALTTRFHREKHVSKLLQLRRFEVFLPCYHRRQRWSDRYVDIDEPFFPGYLFCHFNTADKLSILTVPGVLSIVGIGNKPASIDDAEIASLQSVVASGLTVRACPFVETGQRIEIRDGPLRGSQGTVLDCSRETNRLIVSVTLLRRSVAVSIDPDWVIAAHH